MQCRALGSHPHHTMNNSDNRQKKRRPRSAGVQTKEGAVEERITRASIDSSPVPLADVKLVRMDAEKPTIRECITRWFHPLHLGVGSCSVVTAFNAIMHHGPTSDYLVGVALFSCALILRRTG